MERAEFAIICVTLSNRSSPWLHFEAGAIAKVVEDSRVCPYLLDLAPSDLAGPLAQFQMTPARREETQALTRQINARLTTPLAERRLNELSQSAWKSLNKQLRSLRKRSGIRTTGEAAKEEFRRLVRRLITFEDFAELLKPPPFRQLSSAKLPPKRVRVDPAARTAPFKSGSSKAIAPGGRTINKSTEITRATSTTSVVSAK
jgi:hypothetical protein